MRRKRKVPIADEEKENAVESRRQRGNGTGVSHGPMYTIMSNVQLNETNHKKYIKELQQLYAKMDHDAFMFTIIKMIKTAMVADDGNEYADTTLLFCSKFVSSYDGEDTHPVLVDICKWLLTTISRNPHIRYRICQFVNMILKALGQEAALDDAICDRIMEYMLNRLHDMSPSVRVQAILAMQRLQVPDNPDDPVLRAYQFHLCSDPSARVRQAVITCMGRNYHTIPYILERLWDVDEKVRRHTYLHMSSFPVRSYKVSQRLTFLQQGLNDRSESVRKIVVTIMLQQWIESYQKDLIALISALKLDSNETEIDRFRKVVKQTLKEIFKRQSKADLLACIPLEAEGEMNRCVPYEKLTMEIALYWQCLTEFLQSEMAEEFDLVVPELSTFCIYVEKFCQSQRPDVDKFELMEFQYKLLSLMEILYTFDLGDEIGRGNLQKLLAYVLKTFRLDEKVIEVVVRCAENLIADQNARIQFFVEIIQDICALNNKHDDLLHDRNLISDLMANSSNADLNLKLSSLKVKILDLEEQEMNFMQRKDYMHAQQLTEQKYATTEQYMNLLQPLLENHPNAEALKRPLQLRQTVKPESILKGLQIAFYMVVSPKVRSLNPSILKLYNDFICRHLASNQIAIRDWALKCGTACSMLYEALAKDVFEELYAQFFKNHNIRIWESSITCIFELLDRYGLDNFAKQEDQSKSKKSGRQLYNTLEFLDIEDDSHVLSAGQGVDVIYMMSHFLDTCDDVCIISVIIIGFCRLILRGYIKSSDIIEKLLLRYFNPSTDSNINQILGVFLENLIQRKKHGLLQPCLLPMVLTVLSAPYENPLHDIRPDTVTRFIIDSTRQESSPITDGHIHNKIALTFLHEMLNNLTNKELCKLLAKELTTLELNVTQNEQLKLEMKENADKLIKADLDPKTVKFIIDFKDIVDGNFNPPRKSAANDSECEEDSTEETENDAKDDDDNAMVENARNKTSVSELVEEAPQQLPPQQPTAASVEVDESTIPPDEYIAASEANNAPAPEMSAPEITDGAIITKDISPTARVPTTYGRENRVGHRYLRKSLNSTRGQSDSEVGDGPPRSPKIRIEARIDSDKKSEQPPSREERQMRNTRARRNLRYGAQSTDSSNVQAPQDAAVVTPSSGRNKRRVNLPTVVVTVNSNITSPTTPTTTERSARRRSRLRQKANSDKAQTYARSKDQSQEPVEQEPKEQSVDQMKEHSVERQANVASVKETRVAVRKSARNAPKSVAVDDLNSPDIIPPSPTPPMSPRTVTRRQRLAGVITTINGQSLHRRATRSQSAQSTRNQESAESNERPANAAHSTTTKSKISTKTLTLERLSLKRAHSTPKPVEIGATTVQDPSPQQKRSRTKTPCERLDTQPGSLDANRRNHRISVSPVSPFITKPTEARAADGQPKRGRTRTRAADALLTRARSKVNARPTNDNRLRLSISRRRTRSARRAISVGRPKAAKRTTPTVRTRSMSRLAIGNRALSSPATKQRDAVDRANKKGSSVPEKVSRVERHEGVGGSAKAGAVATLQQQRAGILARRRLSMSPDCVDDNPKYALKRRGVLPDKIAAVPIIRLARTASATRPSKIPVLNTKAKRATSVETRTVSLSSDGVALRSRVPVTKITRLNLLTSKRGGPLPVELAVPTRARAPANKGAGSKV